MNLQIVWRNPSPVHRRHRWQHVRKELNSAVYVVQEFMTAADLGFWSTTSSLEVVSGGRAA